MVENMQGRLDTSNKFQVCRESRQVEGKDTPVLRIRRIQQAIGQLTLAEGASLGLWLLALGGFTDQQIADGLRDIRGTQK